MGFAVLRIEKIKTNTSLINRYDHDFRLKEVANADSSRYKDDKVLVTNPYGTYLDAYNGIVDSSPIYKYAGPPRKDAVKAIDIVLTYSHESVGKIDMETWEKESVNWLQKTFGKECVVSVVEHNDEGTPHLHAIVIPMVKGRLNATHYLGGKQKMSELQSSYAKAMEPLGLERGLKYSRAEHEVVQAFYAGANKAIEAELPEIVPGETIAQYRERANALHKETSMQAFYYKKQSEKTDNRGKTIALNERLDFEEEKRKAKEENKEAVEFYEYVRDIEDSHPGLCAKKVISAIANTDKFIAEYPEAQKQVVTMLTMLGTIIEWEEEEEEIKKELFLEKYENEIREKFKNY